MSPFLNRSQEIHDIFFSKTRTMQKTRLSHQKLEDISLEFQSRVQWHLSALPPDKVCDPQNACEFTEEIVKTLVKQEKKTQVRTHYLSWQNNISEKMRGILVDWMIQVLFQFKCKSETLFLTVNLVDRYLER